MRRLHPPELSQVTQELLEELQEDVDGVSTYLEQVVRGKALWKSKTSTNAKKAAFAEIRHKLSNMSPGQRCHYCEDSAADEIEHVRPKDLYPGECFRWRNYAYACGPCNGPKNNKFAIIDSQGELVDVTRARNAPVVRPSTGDMALIDLRTEDPLEFLHLDLHDTFVYIPVDDLLQEVSRDPIRQQRASYTIDVLRLNDRENLIKQRRIAFRVFSALLKQYHDALHIYDQAEQDNARYVIRRVPFQSVWISMQRQAREGRAPQRIQNLFRHAPEALEWRPLTYRDIAS